jgi:hypothetical protein
LISKAETLIATTPWSGLYSLHALPVATETVLPRPFWQSEIFVTMATAHVTGLPRPETAKIGDSLEIPRMISGLWQLAGGHDQTVDITSAAQAMDSL